MSRWFRHYAGMMRDDKLVRAALRSKQPVERVVWVWGAILESAAEIDDGGKYEIDTGEIAYFLRADETDIRNVVAALEALGRIDASHVVKWSDRQFQSDRSADRQKRYRDRQRQALGSDETGHSDNGDGRVTAESRHSDVTVTHHSTETDTEKKDIVQSITTLSENPINRARSIGRQNFDSEFVEWYDLYPRHEGKEAARKAFNRVRAKGIPLDVLTAGVHRLRAQGLARQYTKQPAVWLNAGCWDDEAPPQNSPSVELPDFCFVPIDRTAA